MHHVCRSPPRARGGSRSFVPEDKENASNASNAHAHVHAHAASLASKKMLVGDAGGPALPGMQPVGSFRSLALAWHCWTWFLPACLCSCMWIGGWVCRALCCRCSAHGAAETAPVCALSQVVGWVQVVVMLPVNQQQQQPSAGTAMDQQANRLLAHLALQQTMHGGNHAAGGMPLGLQNANSQVRRVDFLPRLSKPARCGSVRAQQYMFEGSADAFPPSNAGRDGHTGHC